MTAFYAPIRFFAGAITPCGYKNSFDDLYRVEDGWRVYLLKGGPGTGKSTLIKRVLEDLTADGREAQVFCCSADPSSLDGVCFPEEKLCLLDATAPHVVEPHLWGACEQIVPLSVCTDEQAMHTHRHLCLEEEKHHAAVISRCRQLLVKAASFTNEAFRLQRENLDEDSLLKYAAGVAAREFPEGHGEGQEHRRYLSAVTSQGVLTFFETAQALCPRLYILSDDHGAASALLLSELRKRALSAGLTVISCHCPLFPESRLEHLLIPSLGLAFLTSNRVHTADFPAFCRIHAARFCDTEALQSHKQRLSFCHRSSAELLDGAAAALAEAHESHERMEAIYATATDWDRVGAIQEQTAQRLKALLT